MIDQDQSYSDVLSSLQKRLRAIGEERAKLQRAIEALEALVEPGNPQQIDLLPAVRSSPAAGSGPPTYAEAAEKILRGMGRPLHITMIMDAALARGWFPSKDPGDRNFSNAVYAALDRRKDLFRKTDPATFALCEWHTGTNGTAPASEKSEVGEG